MKRKRTDQTTNQLVEFLGQKYSITQIVEQTKLSRPTVLKFMSGDKKKINTLSIENLTKLVNLFGVSVVLLKFESNHKVITGFDTFYL